MKTKLYQFNEEKHDKRKLTRAFFKTIKRNGVPVECEVNNPEPVHKIVKGVGEMTVDERIRKQIQIMLMKERMRAEMNSVVPIRDAMKFDKDFGDADLYDLPTIASLAGSDIVQELIDTTREDDHTRNVNVTLKEGETAAPPQRGHSEAGYTPGNPTGFLIQKVGTVFALDKYSAN